MFSNSESIYEKSYNLPSNKISIFAKYLADYYLAKKSRISYISGTLNEEVCKSMLIPIARSNSRNLKYYFYILKKYNVKCTLDKLKHVSLTELANLRNNNIVSFNRDKDGEIYYRLSVKDYKEIKKEDEEKSIENKILFDGYKDLATQYGEACNWSYNDGQYKVWMAPFDDVRLYPTGLAHYEMALGIGYVYNILLADPSLEVYFS